MALAAMPGGFNVTIGEDYPREGSITFTDTVIANETVEGGIIIGNLMWADGGSHTVDTTGSSSLQWKHGATLTHAGASPIKIGLATVDTTTGPPGRAVNSANVITFDVSVQITAGLTANTWITSVPTSGTKTIANGELIAFAVQMITRNGADTFTMSHVPATAAPNRPYMTFLSSTPAYNAQSSIPVCVVTASDGTVGWFYGGEVAESAGTITYNNSSSPNEYGQLFDLPFGFRVYGLYAWVDPTGDFSLVLYSDPLGTPVAEKTVTIDLNQVAGTGSFRRVMVPFPSPYSVKPNQKIVAAIKPTTSTNIIARYKRLNNAAFRAAYTYGTRGYGVSRSSGAFADANSSKDQHYIGLLGGAFGQPAQSKLSLGF